MRPISHGVVAWRDVNLAGGDICLVLSESASPQEPCQVFTQSFGADSPESGHEPVEQGVERVDAVDGVVVGLGLGEHDAQCLHGRRVCGRSVGDGVSSRLEPAVQRGDGAGLGDDAAPGRAC